MPKPTRTHRRAADARNIQAGHHKHRTYPGRQQHPHHTYYIAPGSRPDLIPLLKFHYLPHLPATTKAVFRAVDKHTGKLIAVCSLGYPTLRSSLRETVFGRLYPSEINLTFTQLQRLIVHPRHAHKGLARRLLTLAIRSTKTRVVEATNRNTVPAALFLRCGMTQVKGPTHNYYYKARS